MAAGEGSAPLTDAEQMELRIWSAQLREANRTPKVRLEAAGGLLTREYAQARKILRETLLDSTNVAAQTAVAEAIALQGGGRKEFVDPLLKLLTGDEPSVRTSAARALATYKDQDVTGKLVAVALDRDTGRDIRIVAIEGMQSLLEKSSVDALIQLLDDKDPSVRKASLEALEKMTNITAFKGDTREWKRWWMRNKNRPRSVWLADLANKLASSKAQLEADNAKLRGKLLDTLMDLYAATPQSKREELLLRMLRDPIDTVRSGAIKLTERQVAANETVSDEIRKQVRRLLGDPEPDIRTQAALVVATLDDQQAAEEVIARLKVEGDLAARRALLKAVGQLRIARAVPMVLDELDSRDGVMAAPAALALARLAASKPLSGKVQQQAVDALVKRYQAVEELKNHADTREALVTAMGVVGDKRFLKPLTSAIADDSTTVRLAAVNALTRLDQAESVESILPLLEDQDRGVRQAALVAVAKLGGREYLDRILKHTSSDAEREAAVRQQAWDLVSGLLEGAKPELLEKVVDRLSRRTDSLPERIEIMQRYVAALKSEKSPKLPVALRMLAQSLVKADRSGEAAPHFQEAARLYAARKDSLARDVWLEWISAQLQANSATAVAAIAEQKDPKLHAQAMERLRKRLNAMDEQEEWISVVQLGQQAVRQLAKRLDESQIKALSQMVEAARDKQRRHDAQQVAKLVPQLASSEESVRGNAASALQSMGGRAVTPLLTELEEILRSDNGNADLEAEILKVLKQIAPELTGYDTAASSEARIEQISNWRKTL